MELFNRLFGSLLVFVYHCFDRVVINGYLFGLSRPEQLSYFYRNVLGIAPITEGSLSPEDPGISTMGRILCPQPYHSF